MKVIHCRSASTPFEVMPPFASAPAVARLWPLFGEVDVVKPLNALMARRKTEPEPESATRECPECLSSIPVAARRCAFCTAEVGPAPAPAV